MVRGVDQLKRTRHRIATAASPAHLCDKRQQSDKLVLLLLGQTLFSGIRHSSIGSANVSINPRKASMDPPQALIVIPLRSEIFRIRSRISLDQILQRRQVRSIQQTSCLGPMSQPILCDNSTDWRNGWRHGHCRYVG